MKKSILLSSSFILACFLHLMGDSYDDAKVVLESYLKDSDRLYSSNLSKEQFDIERIQLLDNYLPVFAALSSDKGLDKELRKRFLHELMAILTSFPDAKYNTLAVRNILMEIAPGVDQKDLVLWKDFLDFATAVDSDFGFKESGGILKGDYEKVFAAIGNLNNPVKEISFLQNYINFLKIIGDTAKYNETLSYGFKYVKNILAIPQKNRSGNVDNEILGGAYLYFFEKSVILNDALKKENKLEFSRSVLESRDLPIATRVNSLCLAYSNGIFTKPEFFSLVDKYKHEIASSPAAYLIERMINFHLSRGNIEKARKIIEELESSNSFTPQLREVYSDIMKGNKNEK